LARKCEGIALSFEQGNPACNERRREKKGGSGDQWQKGLNFGSDAKAKGKSRGPPGKGGPLFRKKKKRPRNGSVAGGCSVVYP